MLKIGKNVVFDVTEMMKFKLKLTWLPG